ncbi:MULTISPECIES: TetR/AcrR family transcriptional regulator [unclassified Rhodococcus (in: high G+C Gram-positive bacteria)]|uniref:TetR/AcrR family transcriptional regulator n=1 Tax=unclassified Rhodococcus (in: high G+C Gram-positive bacteria) TaxID=192944 RepID=UPI002952AFE0|nr:TetR family transcriptional regulator [Rhodococcus sp. IEGM 1318]MDV8007294.1 TetR family transcriptional regulator [Rhodococcus sp. IEGM 1318]MDZ7913283.1 TetR family transcriptional regulator [Rhodococcus sp. (in: high G+C Gram-positive bacteria)]
MGTETLGLRERKRIATRQLIEHTAVELVLELGYDEVTVEKICEACNLSSRTFFNYFPTKDAAIGGLMLVVPSETTMLTLISEHPDDPLRGALAVFEVAMQIVDERPDLLAHRRELFERHPTLLQQHLATFHDLEDTLTRLLTRELRRRPDYRQLPADTAADEATATVITAGAAMRYVFRKWQGSERAGPRTELLDPALLLMARILRSAN